MKHSVNHRPWINFKELRSRLNFEDVLKHYKVEVRRKGEQHQGPCPLPRHSGSKTAHMFSANLTRGIFQCFGCKARGNALEFAALMEGVDIQNGTALRNVAVSLQARFFLEGASSQKRTSPAVKESTTAGPMPIVVNAPLDFALKDLDPSHPWFADHGISEDTAMHFGLGYCSRGLLKDRIAIPLHNAGGQLIGYAGRAMDESLVSDVNPLYLFPSKREREGKVLDFRRAAFLYNGHGMKSPCSNLIVVTTLHSVWWLHQCGFTSVVGLTDSKCSEDQAKLLISHMAPNGCLKVMPDEGEDGERLALSIFAQVGASRPIRWVKLGAGEEASDLAPEMLEQHLA